VGAWGATVEGAAVPGPKRWEGPETYSAYDHNHALRRGLVRRRRRDTRATQLPYKMEHADALKRQPDQATVTLSLTDDVFLQSSNWACLHWDPAAGGLSTHRRK
jgi:hypothetical protein